MILSKKAIQELIIEPEISSEKNYNARLQYPIWPGGSSGVTIGFGYDIGTQSVRTVRADLTPILGVSATEKLTPACGVLGSSAKIYLTKSVKVSWEQAKELFYNTSLKKACKEALSIYNGLDKLHPYEQTAIVGLVYNRGTALKDKPGRDRRKEMRMLIGAIQADNDTLMASYIRQMKRLWNPSKMKGLIDRREKEAQYIEMVDTPIPDDDKLIV